MNSPFEWPVSRCTRYPVGTGFTGHRNIDVVRDFMVQKLGFETTEAAGAVRDKCVLRSGSVDQRLPAPPCHRNHCTAPSVPPASRVDSARQPRNYPRFPGAGISSSTTAQ